ncbi:hypothetical protein D3C87_1485380 [compost metagenome]
MALAVHLHPTVGFVIAIQARAHGHEVNVPAHGWIGEGPIGAEVVAVEFDPPRTTVLEALGETFDIALQAALADEQAEALDLPAAGFGGIQVMAHLIALGRTVEAGGHGAGPALVEIAAIGTTPTGRDGTGFAQQALFALAVVERAQRLQSHQLRGWHHHRIHGHLQAVQWNRIGTCHRRWQRRSGGGRLR